MAPPSVRQPWLPPGGGGPWRCARGGRATHRGRERAAGEFGHLPFADRRNRCGCGAYGCWGTAVGARALAAALGEPEPVDPRALARRVTSAMGVAVEVQSAALGTRIGCTGQRSRPGRRDDWWNRDSTSCQCAPPLSRRPTWLVSWVSGVTCRRRARLDPRRRRCPDRRGRGRVGRGDHAGGAALWAEWRRIRRNQGREQADGDVDDPRHRGAVGSSPSTHEPGGRTTRRAEAPLQDGSDQDVASPRRNWSVTSSHPEHDHARGRRIGSPADRGLPRQVEDHGNQALPHSHGLEERAEMLGVEDAPAPWRTAS